MTLPRNGAAAGKASDRLFQTSNPAEQERLRRVEEQRQEQRRTAPLCYTTTRYQGGLYEAARANPDLAAQETKWEAKYAAGPAFVRETFSRLFEPAIERLSEDEQPEGVEWAEKAHDLMGELPEMARLQKRTAGDRMMARIGATTLADAVLDAMPDETQPEDPREEAEDLDALEGLPGFGPAKDASRKALAKAIGAGEKVGAAMDPAALREAIRKAAGKANEELDAVEEALAGFGWDESAPAPTKTGQDKETLANRIRNNKRLAQIAERAGRMVRIASQEQREKTRHGCSEVAGVEVGRDLSRMLPTEAAKLAAAPVLFLRDFAEGKLLQYRLQGDAPAGRGPIVVCSDESGSMSGDPDCWAKAFAMGMFQVARAQSRSSALVHFSSRVGRTDVWSAGRIPVEELLDSMEHFENGGTSFCPALDGAREIIEHGDGFRQADIIFITDGFAPPPDWTWWESEKARLGFRVHVVLIGIDADEDLKRLAAGGELLTLRDLSEGSEDKALALFRI